MGNTPYFAQPLSISNELFQEREIGGKVNPLASSFHFVDVGVDKHKYMVDNSLNVDFRAGLYYRCLRVNDRAPAFKLEGAEGDGANNCGHFLCPVTDGKIGRVI